MRTAESWLKEYEVSHRHPTNIIIHKICVPLIMFSLLGMIWAIPVPAFFAPYPVLNWSTIFAGFCGLYYFTLSIHLALGMMAQSIIMIAIINSLSKIEQFPHFYAMAGIFVVAWIFQFIGHKLEGKKPSFLKDILFLFIGPLWVMQSFYNLTGLGRKQKLNS